MINILDTKIDFYPGKIWVTTKLGELSLRQFIKAHKNPKPEIKEIFKKIAQAELDEDWETKGKLKQENLYYFTPCVKLDGKGRSYSNIETFQKLMVLDFDHLEIDADEFRDRLFYKYRSIICAYKSPSSNGVKALVRIPKVTSTDEFKEYFYGFAYEMEGVKSFDASGGNSCLPLFLSWDENIKWREDAIEWTQRGGRYDEFEPFTGDFEEVEDVTDEDKKTVLERVYNIVKKADEENVGHPNIVSSSMLFGGFVSAGYLTYDEAEHYMFQWIDDSPYLSAKADTYKRTSVTMLNKGLGAPLFLKKHQHKQPKEITEKQNRPKRDRKYFLLLPHNKFEIKTSS